MGVDTRKPSPAAERRPRSLRAETAAEQRLAAIVNASPEAIVSRTPEGIVESWNPAAEELYGYTAEEMIGQPISRIVRPIDRDQVKELNGHLAGEGGVLRLETCAQRKDGTLVDVAVSISTIADEDGEVVAIASIAHDISVRKRADAVLREARERFAGAFSSAPIGMALVSLEGTFIDVNPAICDFLDRPEEELRALTFQEITHPDDLQADLDLLKRLNQGLDDRYEMEKRYVRPDGSLVWGLLCVSLVRDGEDAPLYYVSQVKDITALKQQDDELRRLAAHLNDLSLQDPLTGLGNYRAYDGALERALASAIASPGGSFALVLFDVDGLKDVNDDRGHLGGDLALRGLAEVLSRESRDSDAVFRIGGDEFALVLEGSTQEEAEASAQRVAEAVAESSAGIGVSFGVASFPAAGRTRDALVTRADVALYAAKPRLSPKPQQSREGLSLRASQRVQRVLALAREQLGVDLAFFGEVRDGKEVFRLLDGDGDSFGLTDGDEMDFSMTYCRRMITGQIDEIVPDTAADPVLREIPLTREAGIGAYIGVPLVRSDGDLLGLLCGLSHDPKPDLSTRDAELLRFLGGLVTETLERDAVEARERTAEIELSGVAALVAALEARDHYTGEHSKGVVELATAVARRLGLGETELGEIEQVAVLHDVGKVAIPDSILQKNGPLSPSEWELMRQHPAVGERIVASTETLTHLSSSIRAEHEHFDGNGYPDGLSGEAIPIASRITLACDAFHAMTSDRPYRKALPEEAARAELERNAGSQFDPRVVAALLEELDQR